MKKKRTEITLERDFWWKLKIIAYKQEKTLSALFREILREYVNEYEKKTSINKKGKTEIMV